MLMVFLSPTAGFNTEGMTGYAHSHAVRKNDTVGRGPDVIGNIGHQDQSHLYH